MQPKIGGDDSVLSPRHLQRISEWATRLSEDKTRVWTKDDAKLALLVLIAKKRLMKEYREKRKKEIKIIDF